ncbi:MAG: hypothetical protein K2Q09_00925 [Phycisphaerales bacterium]|nr:hypothetical protein [Phycisphaerales bacterium]
MRSFGSLLVLLGAISIVLKLWFVGYYHLLLTWVDNWGDTAGWCIRIGIVALGGLLMGLGSRRPGPSKAGQSPQL